MGKNTVAKLSVGTIILLYGIYGYSSGEIYKLPSKYMDVEELSVSGSKLVYCVLSYISFSLVFYIWAFPKRSNLKLTKKGFLKTTNEIMMAIFLVSGAILQVIS